MRGAVDPVDVLDHQHGRAGPGQRIEQPEHTLEQPRLAEARGGRPRGRPFGRPFDGRGRAVRGQLRHDRREVAPGGSQELIQRLRGSLARESAQGRRNREIWKPAGADVEALPHEHEEPPCAGRSRRLLDQARLADPCLAPDDDEPRGAVRRGVDLPGQGDDVTLATDKDRARDPGGHGDDGTAGLKSCLGTCPEAPSRIGTAFA